MIQHNPTKLKKLVANYDLSSIVHTNKTHTFKGDSAFFPHNIVSPKISLSDRLTTALDEITSTLAKPTFQRDNPSLQFNNETILAIYIVASIL